MFTSTGILQHKLFLFYLYKYLDVDAKLITQNIRLHCEIADISHFLLKIMGIAYESAFTTLFFINLQGHNNHFRTKERIL